MPRVNRRAPTAAAFAEAGQLAAVHFDDDLHADQIAVLFADQFEAEPMVGIWMLAAEAARDNHGTVDGADDEIGPAVVVQIADSQTAAAVFAVEEISAALRDVNELAIVFFAARNRHVVEQDGPLLEPGGG